MHIYDLTFADGKTCRSIVLEPCDDPTDDVRQITNIFRNSYLASCERIIQPPPEKLPWKRHVSGWRLHKFELAKDGDQFKLTWPGGELLGGKDEVSRAVRDNWAEGC